MPRTESPVAIKYIASPNYDSPRGKRSQLIVVHDVESPLTQGYADSLAVNWFGKKAAQVSAHYILGPSYAIQMVPETARAWHCGPAGNICTIGIEQTGYARFSRAQWTTSAGRLQIKVLANLIYDIGQRRGARGAVRRATNAEIRAYANGGSLLGGVMWCTHHQITQSLGHTTHTDPDPNYPYDLLQAELNAKAKPAKPAGKPTIIYVVKRGDKLSQIAIDHDVTVPQLVNWNKIANPNLIYIGQKLIISGTANKETPVVTPQQRYNELADQYGISKAAFGHFRTAFAKVVDAESESATRRYLVDLMEMFKGKNYNIDQWLHLLRAQLNIEEAKK